VDGSGATRVSGVTRTHLARKPFGFWIKVAGALCVMSLGLPWVITNGTSSTLIPGWYVPGFCRTVTGYDGWSSMECDPGFVGAPILNPGTTGSTGSGAETAGRFGIVAALASILFASRSGKRKFLSYGGIALLWTAGLSTGVGAMTSGVLVAWMAAAILLWQGSFGRTLRAKLGVRTATES
jgi:hypothetical protein